MIVTFLFIIFVSFKIVLICFSIITLHLWSGKLFHEFAMVFFPMNFLPVFSCCLEYSERQLFLKAIKMTS